MTGPRISVCIPTYNYARYLPQAIESVLQQTFADFELIVADDGSSDGTSDVLKTYASRDKRIRVVINPNNIGMVHNWNQCLFQARGEYIKFVFADDFLLSPDALRIMLGPLESDKKIAIVGSARQILNDELGTVKTLSLYKKDKVVKGVEIINRCLAQQENLIGEPTAVMFRRQEAARGFNTNYLQLVDLEMWFHQMEKGWAAFVSEPLCAFRRHPLQKTIGNRTMPLSVLDDVFSLYAEYMGKEYVTINKLVRKYIFYDNLYQIWRLYLRGRISREAAEEAIEARFSYRQFRRFYPIYKMYKPIIKAYRWLTTSGTKF